MFFVIMPLTAPSWPNEPKTRRRSLLSCAWKQRGGRWPTSKNGWTPRDGKGRPSKAACFVCLAVAGMRARRASRRSYSITSSAVANISGGMVQPIAFAVLRLMISSNLVTCSTGRSAGLAPFRILSTK
jgi:hypothetical protein